MSRSEEPGVWRLVSRTATLVAMVLMITDSATATTLYVAPEGNDLTGDGSAQLPYRSIQKAVTACVDGQNTIWVRGAIEPADKRTAMVQGRSYTVEGYADSTGDGGIATVSATMDCPILSTAGGIGDTLIIRNLSISTSGHASGAIAQMASDSRSMTIENCTLVIPAGRSGPIINIENATGPMRSSLTISNCTLTHHGTGSSAGLVKLSGGITSVTIQGCRFNGDKTAVEGLFLRNRLTNIVVANNTISTGGAVFDFDANIVTSRIRVVANTLTSSGSLCFALVQYDVGAVVELLDNTVQSNGAGICVGTDGMEYAGAIEEAQPGFTPYRYVQVVGNTVSRIGSNHGHGVMLGNAVVNGECAYNKITGLTSDYCLVLKGRNFSVHHNVLIGRYPMLISRGGWHHIHNNTCRAMGPSPAFVWKNNNGGGQDNQHPRECIVTDNVFDGSMGTYAFQSYVCDSNKYYHRDFIFDRNILVAGSRSLAQLNGCDRASITEIQAAWNEEWADAGPGAHISNDARSVAVAAAGFVDAQAGDLRLTEDSPCRGSAGTLYNSVGAWAFVCFAPEDADLDGVADYIDNCPTAPNFDQADQDGDGTGDACDLCPTDPGKTLLGACGCEVPDTDSDADAIPDCLDNCPGLANPDQADADSDGIGDPCDSPSLVSAASRKTHGMDGAFDITLPLDPGSSVGVECRKDAATMIVLTFSRNVMARDNTPDATEVSLSAGVLGAVTIFGSQMIVNLSGVPDMTCLVITLSGITDSDGNLLSGDSDIHICALLGDTNGSGGVSVADVNQTRSRSGQTVNAGNFRSDTNCSGSISVADVNQVRSRSGNSVACP